MESDGGGWTVFLSRQDTSPYPQVDFNRTWQDYKVGFGSPYNEYYLGECLREIWVANMQIHSPVKVQSWFYLVCIFLFLSSALPPVSFFFVHPVPPLHHFLPCPKESTKPRTISFLSLQFFFIYVYVCLCTGNELLHVMTQSRAYTFRLDVQQMSGGISVGTFETIRVADEDSRCVHGG